MWRSTRGLLLCHRRGLWAAANGRCPLAAGAPLLQWAARRDPRVNRVMKWLFYLYYPLHLLLIGLLSKSMDIPEEQWEEAIRQTVPQKALDVNLKAFQLGRAVAERE